MELTLCHVSRKRKGHLQDLSFTVKNGFITGLVGKNGAGKTTLFHTIMSVKKDYDGEILADGMPLAKNRERCIYAEAEGYGSTGGNCAGKAFQG